MNGLKSQFKKSKAVLIYRFPIILFSFSPWLTRPEEGEKIFFLTIPWEEVIQTIIFFPPSEMKSKKQKSFLHVDNYARSESSYFAQLFHFAT